MIAALTVLAVTLSLPAGAAALAPAIARSPGAEPRGTVILLPASGWASPTLQAQQTIWSRMAPTLFKARYRTVAIDYERGAGPALDSIRTAVLAERRRTRRGPLCLYGESSGGHLAVLTANRMPEVDCVITFGAPFSFHALAADAAAHPEMVGYANSMEVAIKPTFGDDPAGWEPWEPAYIRTPLRAAVLAMICADDPLVPPSQVHQLPGAKTFVAPSGQRTYVHGSISGPGLRSVRARILRFLAGERRRAFSARRN